MKKPLEIAKVGLLVFVTNTSKLVRYGNLVLCPSYCVGFIAL